VLYEENREERKQLLDHMIFGTKDALPLPQLSQVCKLFLHTKAKRIKLPDLGFQAFNSSLSLSLSQEKAHAKPILFNPHFMSRLFSPAHHCPQRVLIMFL
jgi:hypothetical protein